MRKIYDSPHQQYTIKNWKLIGLICREGETYKDIYYHVMSVNNCELCNLSFETRENIRRMDHDHNTGYFRKVLCNKCNVIFDAKLSERNKTGHKWISPRINKQRPEKIFVSFQYQRKGFKRKTSLSLTKLIALSFIHLLKEPI